MKSDVLEDLLKPGLRLVICGTQAGFQSAAEGSYYARSNNHFWRIIHESGLTPSKFLPRDYRNLLDLGIGLTDLAKRTAGPDSQLTTDDFDLERFSDSIKTYAPKTVAFNGKEAASVFSGTKTSRIKCGLQDWNIFDTRVFVLPSSAGGNGHFNKQGGVEVWQSLAAFVKS